MNLNELARLISKSQGTQTPTIPEIKHVLTVLSRLLVLGEEAEVCLMKHGQRLVNREISTRGLDADI